MRMTELCKELSDVWCEEIACVGRKIVAVFGESVSASVSVSASWNANLWHCGDDKVKGVTGVVSRIGDVLNAVKRLQQISKTHGGVHDGRHTVDRRAR